MNVELKHLAVTRPLAALDLETTGTDVRIDRIVEAAVLVARPGNTFVSFHCRVNPCRTIPASASRVHGIYDADVADAPPFSAVAPELLAALDGCDLTGFGVARFDLPILAAEFARIGLPFRVSGRVVVDVLSVYHRMEPRDLTAASTFYLGRVHNHAHSAAADAACALAVLDAQVGRYKFPRTVSELYSVVAGADVSGVFHRDDDGQVVFGFGKHRGRPLSQVASAEPSYLEWMLRKGFLDDAQALVRAALAACPQG